MGRIFRTDSFSFIKADSEHVTLLSGGVVTIGGQQYVTQGDLTLDTSVSGVPGGLDQGTIQPFTVYYLHVVLVSGSLGIVASTSKIPTGFNSYGYTKTGFFTDDQSNVGILINSVNWQTMPFTPVGQGWVSNCTYTGRMSRSGKYADFEYGVALSGAQDPNRLNLLLPAGLSIDTDAIPLAVSSDNQMFGIGTGVQDGASIGPFYVLSSANSISMDTCWTASGGGNNFVTNGGAALTNNSPVAFDGSCLLVFRFRIPIDGWTAYDF